MRRLLCVLTVATVTCLTACGSTVQQQGGGAAGGAPGVGGIASGPGAPGADGLGEAGLGGVGALAPGDSTGTAFAGGAAGPVSAGTTGAVGGPAGAGSGPVGAPGSAPVTATGVVPAGRSGPGVTDKVIKVGIVAAEDPNEGSDALGLEGLESHPLDQIYKAVIDDLNKRGGIGGRSVKLVVEQYGSDATNDSLQSAACERFTKDEPVYTVLTSLGESAQTCFEKNGVSTVSGGYAGGYGLKQHARYPHLIATGAFDLDNQLTTVVNGLRAQGWLGGWNPVTGTSAEGAPHVGILAFDLPAYRDAVKNRALPGLAAAGVKETQVSFIRPNVNDGTADAQATVQKFKAEGVSHVMFLDNSGGAMPLIFSINANSQAYFPRYGCDSGSCNYLVATQMPQPTLRGAVLVGWAPLVDVPESHDVVLPGRARCEKVMRDGGLTPRSRNDLNVMANVCSGVWFFEAATRAAGQLLTSDTLLQGAYKVGNEEQSPATFQVKVTPQKKAGANAYRYAAWDPGCGGGSSGCFIYSGPVRRFDS